MSCIEVTEERERERERKIQQAGLLVLLSVEPTAHEPVHPPRVPLVFCSPYFIIPGQHSHMDIRQGQKE